MKAGTLAAPINMLYGLSQALQRAVAEGLEIIERLIAAWRGAP